MRRPDVTLEDKFLRTDGRVYITGIQAVVRVLLDQHRLDKAAGLNTAGYVSGYRGSPLGGLDTQARRAKRHLDAANVVFHEGVNEDLAATAVWGSQQTNLMPGARYEGVFGMWYGKAPGVDRTGDAFKHGNMSGVSPTGGILAVAGDDHMCKSSTLPSQSEFALADCEIPFLSPAGVQEVLDYGLMGYALSRYSGLWAGMLVVPDNMDAGATIDVDLARHRHVIPTDFEPPPGGLGIRLRDPPLEKERRLRLWKVPAALAFARANRLDRLAAPVERPRLGIVCHGQAYRDLIEALAAMGLTPGDAARLGVAVYKVAMPWPLEPQGVREFAAGLETLLVVEHKRALLEDQVRNALYDLPEGARPRVVGKRDEAGRPLLHAYGALTIPEIAKAVADRLPAGGHMDRVQAYLDRAAASGATAAELASDQARKPFFCSGCPHNISTKLPDGSRALAGIGCHYLATYTDPKTDMNAHMGGEGMSWAGTAPFTDERHVFTNLGDGTYNHSGSLAIRAMVGTGANITYKILYNDAVAMTGGQTPDSDFTPAQITRQVAAEGVSRIVVVADDVSRYEGVTDLAPGTTVRPRTEMDDVQRELREVLGVTVLLYDQVCATEKRRRRKRGTLERSIRRAVINPLVCEGCGDCSRASNCISIEPLETEFGRKRQINQSSCNQDLSCVEGFCPSFVTLDGAANAHAPKAAVAALPAVPEPVIESLSGVRNIVFTGVGGTGVTTVAAILAVAAHLDGRAASGADMTGLSQKNGAVFSHVRIGEAEDTPVGGRVPAASADVIIAGDLMTAASADALMLSADDRTRVCGDDTVSPTGDFVLNRLARFDAVSLGGKVAAAARAFASVPAHRLAEDRLGDAIYANMILLGFAWQQGWVPVTGEALRRAIELNGIDAAANLQAFELGRAAAHDPAALDPPRPVVAAPEAMTLDALIEHRAGELSAYQDQAYADRFRRAVERVRTAESRFKSEALTRAAAVSLFRLMAYKDEYEVARLYSDGRFAAHRDGIFKGGRAKVWLSPPILAPKDSQGRPRKVAFGGWMLDAGFPLLARLKGLRGTALDVFGYTHERRAERALAAAFEAELDRLAGGLTAERLPLAVKIAEVPQSILGYGHVKAKAMTEAAEQSRGLWAQWDAAPALATA